MTKGTPVMNCGKAQRLISAAMDGELAEASAGMLRAHLAGCPDCRAISQGFAGLSASLEVAGPPEPHFGFSDRLMRRIDAADRPAPMRHRRLGWLGLAPVALAALAFCVGVWTTTLTYAQDATEATTSRPSFGQSVVGIVNNTTEESFETTLAGLLPEWETDQ